MANKTWSGGNYGTAANWSNQSAPSSNGTDDIFINANNITCTFNGTPKFNNITINGTNVSFAGTVSLTIYGDFIVNGSVSTWPTGTITFVGAGITHSLKTTGITFGGSIIFATIYTGTKWKLLSNFTVASGKSVTLSAGELDLDIYNLSCGTFTGSPAGYGFRSINFGSTGTTSSSIIITTPSSTTAFVMSDSTYFTLSGSPRVEFSSGSWTRTINVSSSNTATTFSFYVNGDALSTLKFSGISYIKNLDLSNFSGTVNASIRYILGNYIQGANTTIITGAETSVYHYFQNYSALTTNSISFNGDIGVFSFGQGLFSVTGSCTVYRNSGKTTYGKPIISNSSVVNWYADMTCQSMTLTNATLNLFGTITLLESSSLISTPAFKLTGSNTYLNMYGGTIDATAPSYLANEGGYFVVDQNGTSINFGNETSKIKCKFFAYGVFGGNFSYSGISSLYNTTDYQIEILADSTADDVPVVVWNWPDNAAYTGNGFINVYFAAGGDFVSTHVVNNQADRFGFVFDHDRDVNLINASVGSLNLTTYAGTLNVGSSIDITGNFISEDLFTLTGEPTWNMLGSYSYRNIFDFGTGYFTYPITLNFNSPSGCGYIMCGNSYESTYPINLYCGVLDCGINLYDYPSWISGSITVPSVNLDAGTEQRIFNHGYDAMIFFLTGLSGTIWSSKNSNLYVYVNSNDQDNVPGCTIYIDNPNAVGVRTVAPGFHYEEDSFNMVVFSGGGKVVISGTSALNVFKYSVGGTLDFTDLTIYGEFEGTAISNTSTLRVLGYRTSEFREEYSTNDYLTISGHAGGKLNSKVLIGNDSVDPAIDAVIASDIGGDLIINNSHVTFDIGPNSFEIGGDFIVVSEAPSGADTILTLPNELIVKGSIYFQPDFDYVTIIEQQDTIVPNSITMVSNTSTSTTTFEVGNRQFLNTSLIFDNSKNSGTFAILDDLAYYNVIDYNLYENYPYPGFIDISATVSSSTNKVNLQFQSDRNFLITNTTNFTNINKISSTIPGDVHNLVFYNIDNKSFEHFGTKISRIQIDTSTYIQDSQTNINYMFYNAGGNSRNLGNNTNWVFGVVSTMDLSFFYID